MYVTGRRVGETIQIGDVVIHVVRVTGSRVILAVDAPPAVPIRRADAGHERPVPKQTDGEG